MWAVNDRAVLTVVPPPERKKPIEISPFQSFFFGKHLVSLSLDSEFCTPLSAPCTHNALAGLRALTHKKSVCRRALPFFWLVGSFWHIVS